jgi:hypothetical protein
MSFQFSRVYRLSARFPGSGLKLFFRYAENASKNI